MQLLTEVVPGLVRVAVLVNSFNPIHALFWRETEPAARDLGLELQPVEARAPEDFEVAFDVATRSKARALIALDDALTYNHRTRVVALAAGRPAAHVKAASKAEHMAAPTSGRQK